MAGTDYTFDGLDRMEKQLMQMIEQKYPKAFEQEVIKLAYDLQGRVKKLTKVDTARLRNSWRVGKIQKVGDEYMIEVFTNVNYAAHVEHGHRIMKNGKVTGIVKGKHMLQISMNQLQQRLPFELKQWLDDFVRNNPL